MKSKKVTICVLCYGDYFYLAKRVIDSIISNCDKKYYELRVGLNACCKETIAYFLEKEEIDSLYISRENINKCRMMRRLFKDISTDYIWWFDDDSYISEKDALLKRLAIIEKEQDEKTVLWGHVFFFGHESSFDYGLDVVQFVKNQKWYRDKEPPCGVTSYIPNYKTPEEHRWFFVTGGNWIAKTSLIKELGWPTINLIKRNDDVFLCSAIRQLGYNFKDIGPLGVVINDHPRRGDGEDFETMKEQIDRNNDE